MDTLSRRPPSWRRPPLILVAFGLALAYAELAAESEVLAENGLVVNDTTGQAGMTAAVVEGVVGTLVHYPIAQLRVVRRDWTP